MANDELLPERITRCKLEETSDRKRRRSAKENSGPQTKIMKEDFDFFDTRMVQTSLTSPAPVCLASPGLCHQPKLTSRTFPNNILHLLLDDEKEEEEEVEEYDEVEEEEELDDEEFDCDEESVSFKAGSISKRILCLSSPGLCHTSTKITQRSFPPNIAELLQEEGEGEDEEKEDKVDEEKEKEENEEKTVVDVLEELTDEEAFEEPIDFGKAALSASPSLCLAPALCPCNKMPQVFTSR